MIIIARTTPARRSSVTRRTWMTYLYRLAVSGGTAGSASGPVLFRRSVSATRNLAASSATAIINAFARRDSADMSKASKPGGWRVVTASPDRHLGDPDPDCLSIMISENLEIGDGRDHGARRRFGSRTQAIYYDAGVVPEAEHAGAPSGELCVAGTTTSKASESRLLSARPRSSSRTSSGPHFV